MTVEETPVRRRPRNRRRMVLDAAAPIFSERGYHGASMEDVAAKVGITAAALYRHFPNKYALFVECANLMVDRLLEVLEEQPDETTLREVLVALAGVTLDHRASGGLYRWEARYLEVEERHDLRAKFATVVSNVAAQVGRELGGTDPGVRASAALGAIGSITMHRTPIARQRALDLLTGTAVGVASVEVVPAPPTASVVRLPVRPDLVSRRAEILGAAIPLFAQRGFHNVSMGEIASLVGLGSSAIYRHYPTKADILAAGCLQAAATLEQAAGQALQEVRDPAEQLRALAAAHVAYSFENTALISVAEAEIVGLPTELQRPVLLAQREHVALWEQRLAAVRPDLDVRGARVTVHAAFGAVVEAGRHVRWEDTPARRDAVSALMLGALGLSV